MLQESTSPEAKASLTLFEAHHLLAKGEFDQGIEKLVPLLDTKLEG